MAMLTGATMSSLLVPLIAIGAALIPAGVTGWQAYKASVTEADSAMREMAQTQGLIGKNLATLNKALDKGLISSADFTYIQRLLDLGTESALKAAQARMAQLGVSDGQISEYEKLLKLENELRVAVMDRFDQERDKAEANFQKRMAEIAQLAAASKMAANERAAAEQLARDELVAKGDAITKQQQAEAGAAAIKSIEDQLFIHERSLAKGSEMTAAEVYTFRVDRMTAAAEQGKISYQQLTEYILDEERKLDAGEKEAIKTAEQKTKELERQLTLQQEIARAEIQAKLAQVQGNPFLTQQEKTDQSVPLMQEMMRQNAARIAQLQAVSRNDPTQQLEAQKQITDLMSQQAELGNKIATAQHPWITTFAQLKSQGEITMTSLAHTFSSVFNSAINSISNGITGLIMGTMTWAQALRNIATEIVTSIVQAIVQMGVRWVMTQIMMAIAGKSIMAAAIAASAPMAAIQSAIWAVPATLSTIATMGATAAAAPGEIALASALTLGLAGFAEGGFTGNRGRGDIAGFVHGGEYVMPASAVDRIGLDNLAALHHGGSAAAGGAPGGGMGKDVSVYAFTDPRQMADHLQKNDAHEKWVVDVMSRNAHKFR